MKLKNIILVLGGLLLLIGLIKPDLSLWIPSNHCGKKDSVNIESPLDDNIKKEAQEVASLLKSFGYSSKDDSCRLRDLYLDLAKLIELDGDNQVVKNTDEIRQANSIAGVMLELDIKGKYSNLAKETKDVIVAAIGDDHLLLSPELRNKAVDAFKALAWACNEGTK
ncbi:MAG: hypothetical protein EBR82_87545 [Caulobacteraceae bacterium]|nr:hypothetical protein [Caulobacteraceae bacterium]